MRYVQINSVPDGSTGKIMRKKHEELIAQGEEAWIFWGRRGKGNGTNEVKFGDTFSFLCDVLLTFIDDRAGFHSKRNTRKLIKKLNEIKPDILHIHNLHGYYVNIEMLFEWIKSQPNLKVFWTLHDCWAFTGHCAHFTAAKCNKWKSHCAFCKQKNDYPPSIIKDGSYRNFNMKRRIFTGVNDLTLIVPSNWLANLVKDSFLSEYSIEVRHNTIDKNVFKPTPSDFRKKYNIQDKKIVLGVASPWTKKKGLEDFYKLATVLPDDYAIVLVGLNARQRKKAPKEIVALGKTKSQKALAEIYSSADVFLNASKEETFGMTTIEALSCGTTPVVLKGTACEEIVNVYGGEISNDNVEDMRKRIIEVVGDNTSVG